MSTIEVRVEKKVVEAEGIVSLELRAACDVALPAFSAGAHIDLHLPNGLVRQYSLCNSPDDRERYVIAVLREAQSRGGSAAVHDAVAVGDVLQISLPKNHFPLAVASRSLLIAGGIGVTPMLAMAHALHAAGSDFEMHYCARSESRAAFRQPLVEGPFSKDIRFYFDDRGDSLPVDEVLSAPGHDVHLYVCGPAAFIEFVKASAKRLGWLDGNVHFEFFSAPQTAIEQAGAAFEIEIASTGARMLVPEGCSVAEVLYDNGFEIPLSCEQGVCGTCVTRVLAGVPDHRDLYLTEAERERNDKFMPCCSRALSKVLVLEL